MAAVSAEGLFWYPHSFAGNAETKRCRGRRPLTKRILVVDDEEAMGRLIKLNLERHGHAVTMMTDTNAALEAIDAGDRFDLYIIDVNMPAGAPHGLSFARMLEFRRLAPMIIYMTGDPGMAAHPAFKGRTVLAKPIDFALLRRAVADAA
jgi:two-component system, sensor histidine kinase RpfC